MPFSAGDDQSRISLSEGIRQLGNLIESGAPREEINALQERIVDSAGGADRFHLLHMLPDFLRAASKTVDARNIYEHFRLPGQDRVVQDRRTTPQNTIDQARDTVSDKDSKETKEEKELKDGKLVDSKERTYENYFGRRVSRGEDETRATNEQRLERILSKFERTILERFEKGKEIAEKSQDGKPKFLEKTEDQWRQFFQSFRDRMAARKVSLNEVEEFLFRGIVNKGSKGVCISDMTMKNGRIEKFIRFSVITEALANLAKLKPGDSFKGNMLKGMDAEFLYLALAAAKRQEYRTGPLPTAGKFLSGKAEGEAARELGILSPISKQEAEQKESELGRSKKSLFGALLKDKGYEEEDVPYKFVPWWRWGNLQKPLPFKWTTTVFYAALLIVTLIGIGVITLKLINGF